MIPLKAKVRMSKSGKACFKNSSNNPYDLVGVVIETERKRGRYDSTLDCLVKWSNGYRNTYNYNHLEFAEDLSSKSLEEYL